MAVPAIAAVPVSGGARERTQLLAGGGHGADRGRTVVAVKGDGVLGGRGRRILLEYCLDLHAFVRHS